MNSDIKAYNKSQDKEASEICNLLMTEIDSQLTNATSKIWHGAPVWFLNENPVVGYWVRKNHVQLLFWSGQSFAEPNLLPEGKFKAAEARYQNLEEINTQDLKRWLKKAQTIQWDYKNIVKRRGKLEKI